MQYLTERGLFGEAWRPVGKTISDVARARQLVRYNSPVFPEESSLKSDGRHRIGCHIYFGSDIGTAVGAVGYSVPQIAIPKSEV